VNSAPPRSIRTFRVGKDREECIAVRLLEQVVGAIVLRCVGSETVEADLRRLAPAAHHRQLGPAVEHPRRNELDLGALVILDGIASAHVDVVVGAHVDGAADAKGEAAARIGAVEEGVPPQGAAFYDRVDPLEDPLGFVGVVRVQV
jgi:hypothetical protein